MKKTCMALIYITIGLILICIVPNQSSASEPLLQLFYPHGDAICNRTITIEWYAYDNEYYNQEDLPIYLYYKSTVLAESPYQIIAENLPNSGIYNWSIKNIENGEYQLLIEAVNTHQRLTSITSEPFIIQNTFSTITAISMNKGNALSKSNSPVIKNGDTVTIIAMLDCIDPIESSDIIANLTTLGGAQEVIPNNLNDTTASWIMTNVSCLNNSECTISIIIKDESQQSYTFQVDNMKPEIHLIHPDNGVYLCNRRIFNSNHTIIFGPVTFTFDISDNSNIERGEFYLDERLYGTLSKDPYKITLYNRLFGTHNVTLIVYDIAGNTEQISKTIQIFNFI